jgi:DNA mismatch endonuclease (patch repair protein)
MSANKPARTEPEELLFKLLDGASKCKLERNLAALAGRPDLVFVDCQVAIFVHGCFWHHCPHCKKDYPKHNREFWIKKFADNRRRDHRKARHLRSLGWRVFQVWECRLKQNPQREVNRILAQLPQETNVS